MKPRKLSWELREFQASNGSLTPDLFPDELPSWPLDSDRRVNVVIRMSLNEYVELSSAVDVGSDIAYPLDQVRIVAILMRAYIMNICQDIVDAIETCDDVKQALLDFLLQPQSLDILTTNIVNNQAFQDALSAAASTPPLAPFADERPLTQSCNLDNLYSSIVALVDILNVTSQDLLDRLEAAAGQAERADILLDAIPGVGAILPIDEIFQFIGVLASDVAQEYDSAWTLELEQEIRCALFCLFKTNCNINTQSVISWYEARTTSLASNPANALVAIINFIASGQTGSALSVYAMHLLILAALRAGQNVLGIDFSRFMIRVNAASDTPNNDWQALCDECPVGGLGIRMDASPNAIAEFEGLNTAGQEVWRIVTQNLPNTYFYASLVPTQTPTFTVEDFDMETGGFFQWSSAQTGVTTDPNAALGKTTSNLDFYGLPGTRPVFRITVRYT